MAWWRFYWSKPHAPIPINTDIECLSSNQFIVLVPWWACSKMAGDDNSSQNTTHTDHCWPHQCPPGSLALSGVRGQGGVWWGTHIADDKTCPKTFKLHSINHIAHPLVYLTLTRDILFILYVLCTFILHSEWIFPRHIKYYHIVLL